MTLARQANKTQEQAFKEAADLERFWARRNLKFEVWYRFREMYDGLARRGRVSIALNEARTFLDLSIHLLSHRRPKIRVPILEKNEEEQENSGDTERFLHGIQRQIDQGRMRSGNMPWLRALADFAVTTGWASTLDMVMKNDDGTPMFISDVLDPAQVYPNFGYNRMEAVSWIYPTTLGVMQSKAAVLDWKADLSGNPLDDVVATNYYWYEGDQPWYSMAVSMPGRSAGTSDGLAYPVPPQPYDLGPEIPIKTLPMGGWAVRTSRRTDYMSQARMGESIIEAGRPSYDMMDRFATIVLRKADETVDPLRLLRSPSGRWTVSEKDLRAGIAIPVAQGHGIETNETPPLSTDITNVAMPLLRRGIERASVSDLFFGAVDSKDLAGAGYALSILEPNLLSKLIPYAQGIESIGQTRDQGYLEAMRTGGFSPIRLATQPNQTSDARQIYYEDWGSDEIPESSYVDWQIRLATPSQLRDKINIARQALGPKEPILDIDTVLEEVLEADDPAAIKAGIRRMKLMEDPAMQAIDKIIEIREFAEEELADHPDLQQAARQVGDLILTRLTRPPNRRGGASGGQGGAQPALPGLGPETNGTAAPAAANEAVSPAPGQVGNGATEGAPLV